MRKQRPCTLLRPTLHPRNKRCNMLQLLNNTLYNSRRSHRRKCNSSLKRRRKCNSSLKRSHRRKCSHLHLNNMLRNHSTLPRAPL